MDFSLFFPSTHNPPLSQIKNVAPYRTNPVNTLMPLHLWKQWPVACCFYLVPPSVCPSLSAILNKSGRPSGSFSKLGTTCHLEKKEMLAVKHQGSRYLTSVHLFMSDVQLSICSFFAANIYFFFLEHCSPAQAHQSLYM